METPAAERAAMMMLVERPFETFRHVDNRREPCRFQRLARLARGKRNRCAHPLRSAGR